MMARPRLTQTLLLQAQVEPSEDKQFELYERVLTVEPGQREASAGRQRIWEQRGDKALKAGDTRTAQYAYERSGSVSKAVDAGLNYVADLVNSEEFEAALDYARTLWQTFPTEKERLPDLDELQRKVELADLYDNARSALDREECEEAGKLLIQVVTLVPSYREATRYLHLAVKRGEDVVHFRKLLVEASAARDRAEVLANEERATRKQVELVLRERLLQQLTELLKSRLQIVVSLLQVLELRRLSKLMFGESPSV